MLTKQSLKDALQVIGHYKNDFHQKMKLSNLKDEELIKYCQIVSALNTIEGRLDKEIKSSSNTLLNELNK
ncbi:hypothetical protein BN1222_03588 [Klebsiella quasipneumoniae]|uniref:hypothetical protein n=1 Tax=Klebsiella quasipneumoniae TaxID=1463165 RepID=UPI0005E8A5B8|nr:hypothetical protein [Klebsiella quasipneumoniae]CEL82326.1 hypothetical protein BN1222_03588 [Klebsiella quasipneumoniae]